MSEPTSGSDRHHANNGAQHAQSRVGDAKVRRSIGVGLIAKLDSTGTHVLFTGTIGGRFSVSKAEYIGTNFTNGDPIRLYPVVSSLASGKGPTARLQTARSAIKASVNLLGNNDGLIES